VSANEARDTPKLRQCLKVVSWIPTFPRRFDAWIIPCSSSAESSFLAKAEKLFDFLNGVEDLDTLIIRLEGTGEGKEIHLLPVSFHF